MSLAEEAKNSLVHAQELTDAAKFNDCERLLKNISSGLNPDSQLWEGDTVSDVSCS